MSQEPNEEFDGLVKLIQRILYQEAIFQDNVIAGVRLMAGKLRDARQHTLWSVEEMVRLRKRVQMLEVGLDSCIAELRMAKASPGTVQHYERIVADNFPTGKEPK